MITVGIRNLKNSLSRYLKLVKSGETVLITDRNKIIAELVPVRERAEGLKILNAYIEEQAEKGSLMRARERALLPPKKETVMSPDDKELISNIYSETRNGR